MSEPREIYYMKAMYEGLRDAMREDPTVVVIGEDVDRSVIGATRGLVDEFGDRRVRNTPISEATFVGACVGAAASGLRPVADVMFGNFFYVAMDQVANQAARLPYMSGGQIQLPLVLFANSGPAGSNAAQHSENPHPMLMHLGGLKVVMPGSAAAAKGLMYAAVRDPNPVVFLQDAALAGSRGDVPEETYEIPIGVGEIMREGTDITLVAIGALVPQALQAAEALAGEGISAEVIDPRSLVPLDEDIIVESVGRTGRLLVADNTRMACSAASEIAAMVCERSWDALKAPPRRVAWENSPVPFAPVLEQRVLVDAGKIADAVRQTTGRTEVAA